LRIALISMAGEGAGDVRLAGHPVAWHQLQAALALACERIICLVDGPGPALAALQHDAERAGLSFHAVAHHRGLSGLVHAGDTLVAFAPGVLADREWLAQAFGARAGVAVLPAEGAVEQGFERIDRDRAWAGVLATRGDAVEALGALPPDADAIGGLLRVALQRGATGIAVPEKWLDDGRWALVASQASAERYQQGWYARHVPPPGLIQPGRAAAYRLARALVDRARDARQTALALLSGGVVVAVASAIGGYLGYTVLALTGLTASAILTATGTAVARFAGAGSSERARAWPGEARRALLDVSLVALAASPSAFEGWTAAFAALVLVAVMRLAEEPGAPRPLRPLGDRSVVFAALAASAIASFLPPAMALLGIAGLALQLFWPPSAANAGLTTSR
jgi:hypothetical protein